MARRNSLGTNGRGVPVLMSHMRVVDEAKCGTSLSCREDEDEA